MAHIEAAYLSAAPILWRHHAEVPGGGHRKDAIGRVLEGGRTLLKYSERTQRKHELELRVAIPLRERRSILFDPTTARLSHFLAFEMIMSTGEFHLICVSDRFVLLPRLVAL